MPFGLYYVIPNEHTCQVFKATSDWTALYLSSRFSRRKTVSCQALSSGSPIRPVLEESNIIELTRSSLESHLLFVRTWDGCGV